MVLEGGAPQTPCKNISYSIEMLSVPAPAAPAPPPAASHFFSHHPVSVSKI